MYGEYVIIEHLIEDLKHSESKELSKKWSKIRLCGFRMFDNVKSVGTVLSFVLVSIATNLTVRVPPFVLWQGLLVSEFVNQKLRRSTLHENSPLQQRGLML